MSTELNVQELMELQKKHQWLHLTNHKMFETVEPQIMVEGKGMMVKDAKGNEYLDALSGGVWGVNVGFGREDLVDAIAKQMRKLAYFAGNTATPPYIELAAKIAQLTNLQRLFVSNSGSEANEKAFKMVRQYFAIKNGDNKKYKIIYRYRDYHGTTFAALSATGQPERRVSYGPLLDGFVEMPHACCYRCHFGKTYPGCNIECAQELETIINKENADTVAAVILEPITAGGGIIVPVPEYYPVIQQICRKYDVLLIMDEVVNGYGRTGKMFGYQHYDVEPDIATMAKGIASSYMPLSATAVREEIFRAFLGDMSDPVGYFRDISTYGGCVAGCTAALENIRIIENENLVENSAQMGQYLLAGLNEFKTHPLVGDVRGKGLFAGVELVADKATKEPCKESVLAGIVGDVKSQGVIIGRMGRSLPNQNNVLTMAPALIATKADIDRIVGAIGNALAKLK